MKRRRQKRDSRKGQPWPPRGSGLPPLRVLLDLDRGREASYQEWQAAERGERPTQLNLFESSPRPVASTGARVRG